MIKHLPPRKLSKRQLIQYKKTKSLVLPLNNWQNIRLISQDLISVQPMAPPQGILNYLEYVFNNEYEEDED